VELRPLGALDEGISVFSFLTLDLVVQLKMEFFADCGIFKEYWGSTLKRLPTVLIQSTRSRSVKCLKKKRSEGDKGGGEKKTEETT
jgi:hypothetical protein